MTKALTQIKTAQQKWAEKFKKGINLVSGAFDEDGIDSNKDKDYFEKIEYNLFDGKLNNKNAYNDGDGNEIKAITHRPKMSALHSSSALVVNLFQYWQGKDVSPLLKALNMIRHNDKIINAKIEFEDKFKIDENTKKFPKPANLDITIKFEENQIIAIESKFTEPYGSVNNKISKSYTEDSLWNKHPELENLKTLAKEIYNKNRNFQYLDAAQLIKHILGLKNSKYKENFTLLYLWYDVPGTKEAKKHEEEIDKFAKIVGEDNINFCHITYQKVISYLKENYKNEHKDYIKYLVERYSKYPSTL